MSNVSPQNPEHSDEHRAAGETSSALNTPPPSDPGVPTGPLPSSLGRFMDESEFPPDFVAEQKSVLLQPGHVLANRFEVREMLGFGGMGTVYRVTDWRLQEDKALKIMLPSLVSSEAARQRFLAEIKISQRLSHDRIVRVHDFGEDPENNVQFFTMEFVEGKTLHKHLMERGGRLDLDEALGIFSQLLEALAYAHGQTIHRDLKPQNIMLQPNGAIKVLDFGLAKLMSPGRMAKSSMALGTAYYQAPEQSVRKGEVDQRADIYSLGVILYELLVGELPVGRFDPPSQRVSGLPKRVDDVIMKCLSPQPEGRYGSVAELQAALDEARSAKPLVSSPRRLGMVGAVVVLAIVVIGIVAMLLRPQGEAPTTPGNESAAPSPTETARPVDTALAEARESAASARDAASDAWTRVPAEAEQYAAEALAAAEALMKSAAAAFDTGETQSDKAAFDEAAAQYTEAAEQFTAARVAAEEGIAAAAAAMSPEDAALIKEAAAEAREAAVALGVPDQTLGIADGLMMQGDGLVAQGKASDAAKVYEQARAQFSQLRTDMLRALSESAESARNEAEAARTAAANAGATPEELAAGDEVRTRATEFMTGGEFAAAEAEYASARDTYQSAEGAAVMRTRVAEVERAEAQAGLAREAAVSAKATAEEMAAGESALAAARNAASDENFDEALAQLASATSAFREAEQSAKARANAMQADLATQLKDVKAAAAAAREKLTADLRAYAPKESQAADTSWNTAVEGESGGNVEQTIKAYDTARRDYVKAAESASKNITAERNLMADAKSQAEATANQIDSAVREAAPRDVEAGEASLAKGLEAEAAGDMKQARTYFNDAESAFRRAINVRTSAMQAAEAAKEKEKQATAAAEAEAAAKAAAERARQAMLTAKTSAEAARTKADTAVVREHASSELATANAAFNDAASAEKGGKYDQARSLYATATTGFDKAVAAAAEREGAAKQAEAMAAQARETMTTAKNNAQSARSAANTETTREHAAAELQQAERYFSDAESAAAAGEYERAAGLYDQARSAFGTAQSQAQARMAEDKSSSETKGALPSLVQRKRGTAPR